MRSRQTASRHNPGAAVDEPDFPWEAQPSGARLLVFFIQLPDAIGVVDEESPEPQGIPDGLWFVFLAEEQAPTVMDIGPLTEPNPLPDELEGEDFVALGFQQVRAPSYTWTAYKEAIREAVSLQVPVRLARLFRRTSTDLVPKTVVIAMTPMSTSEQAQGAAGVRQGFDRCIQPLADLVNAWRVSQYVSIPSLTPERLHVAVPFATRGLGRKWGWDRRLGMLVVHGNLPDEPTPPYGPGTGPGGLLNAVSLIRKGYPLISYRERLTDAQEALIKRGQRAVAVILAQTAAEVYLDQVLSLLLWEEGVAPEEAAQAFIIEGLARRVRTRFHPRLGGKWSPNSRSPIGRLYHDLFPLRGRVVHGGYDPSFEEAKQAIDTLHLVEEFVLQRLIVKRMVYPSSTLQILGRIGLQDRGHWSGQIRRWADAHDPREEMDKFLAWRQQLENYSASLSRR